MVGYQWISDSGIEEQIILRHLERILKEVLLALRSLCRSVGEKGFWQRGGCFLLPGGRETREVGWCFCWQFWTERRFRGRGIGLAGDRGRRRGDLVRQVWEVLWESKPEWENGQWSFSWELRREGLRKVSLLCISVHLHYHCPFIFFSYYLGFRLFVWLWITRVMHKFC